MPGPEDGATDSEACTLVHPNRHLMGLVLASGARRPDVWQLVLVNGARSPDVWPACRSLVHAAQTFDLHAGHCASQAVWAAAWLAMTTRVSLSTLLAARDVMKPGITSSSQLHPNQPSGPSSY